MPTMLKSQRAPRPTVLFALLAVSLISSRTLCADEPNVFLIEEDWELVINDPAPAINSPQVAFFMYPDAGREDVYFQLQMNYAAEEGYSSGGFRVSAILGETPVDEERSRTRETLNMDGDRLRWTSAMAIFDGQLMYAVKDGQGIQWGSFGGPDYLVRMDRDGISNLNQYDPAKSIEAVDIGFGGNRVSSIRLRRVRYIDTTGNVHTVQVQESAD
ncbi:hypothetical protein [Stieleria varia]|uniref:Uncharacterized protein n=1 Tax=Stieleria varia TaxID=2528005 RepID=A0A5C6ATR1_9BACT|nr:hypothetical protein [Stieleria varia]TWU02801.1 hypothetical protein Pla52n_38610 [Stieleria varia]